MNLQFEPFSQIDLTDPFFDSLKADYAEFEDWFQKKSKEGDRAYIALNDKQSLEAFLYLKKEVGAINDVIPVLPAETRIKVGTFKINPHGTKLGERFIKKIFDHAIGEKLDQIYVTIFPKHSSLYSLLTRYGFEKVSEKPTKNGVEDVLLKKLSKHHNNIFLDYPKVYPSNKNKYLLSIYPEFHTRLFPDSILRTEKYDIIQDISHTNSINKVYVCFMDVHVMNPGDMLIIYRTTDQPGRAWFRAVATSLCTVVEVKTRLDFPTLQDFLDYCEPHSVFSRSELTTWYARPGKLAAIKMVYNAAFIKRLTRQVLIEEVGIEKDKYWGFFKLEEKEFQNTVKKGGIHEDFVVD